jgi:uncharacterized membrane protein
MAKAEYLVFIPLLFYGFALAELFREWKRLFKPKDIYFPYIIVTVILTEIAIYNVFIMTKLLDDLEHQNYLNYLIYLIPPFIFMLVVNVFTPEKEDNTKNYFENNRRSFFLLAAVFVSSHYLFDFGESA